MKTLFYPYHATTNERSLYDEMEVYERRSTTEGRAWGKDPEGRDHHAGR